MAAAFGELGVRDFKPIILYAAEFFQSHSLFSPRIAKGSQTQDRQSFVNPE